MRACGIVEGNGSTWAALEYMGGIGVHGVEWNTWRHVESVEVI